MSIRIVSLLALVSVAGCQAIAGLESRPLDPVVEGCNLPSAGDTKVRFANLVPDDASVDICLRASGASYGRPILRGAGSGCAQALGRDVAGYRYAEVSAPFTSPATKIDVKVITAGSTCSSAALTESLGLDIAAGSVTALARIGDEKQQSIRAYAEDTDIAAPGKSRFRFVHAAPNLPPLDVAVAKGSSLPTDLGALILKTSIPFGASSKGGTVAFGTLDANGYIETVSTKLNIAAAPAGSARAVLLTPVESREVGRTIYAIGDPGKPFFQVRALVCEDLLATGLKSSCTFSALGTISVDVMNAYLFGELAQEEKERRPFVHRLIAERDSDLMCVTSLNRQKDKDDVIALAGKQVAPKGFAYSYYSKSDATTPPTDPRDVRPPFTTPPCGGTNDPAGGEAVVQCVQDNCSTTHTSDGTLDGGSSCMSAKCATPYVSLLGGDKDHQRCFNCLAVSIVSDLTHAEVRDRCLKQNVDYKAFDGATDAVILSKFPLSDTETFVLPSTDYRRLVHHAKAEIEKGKFVDFFCAELTAAYGNLLPYFGGYAPAMGTDPWYQEQLLQAQRVVEYVKKKAGSSPAIITGDWAVSKEFKDPMSMKVTIDDQDGAVLDYLESKGFIPALPKGFVPRCTQCAAPANPYNSDKNIWQFHTYVLNLPSTSGVEVTLFGTALDAVTTSDGRKIPLLDRWGYNTKILRP